MNQSSLSTFIKKILSNNYLYQDKFLLLNSNELFIGGGDRTRTCYLLLAKQPLYQVSYTPQNKNASLNALVGLVGFEPTTPALSRRCSNQLSYRPKPFVFSKLD